MKVGTDAVLLGTWVDPRQAQTLLDIGTGSGVIALILAQRTAQRHARIDAVEFEAADAAQARHNAERSPWSQNIQIHHTPIQDFMPGITYDLIVTNPPYFSNSQMPPNQRRGQTRHTTTLDHQTLIRQAGRLLSANGTFNVVLPFTEGTAFVALASQAGFNLTRQYAFRTRQEKPVERWLLEFSRQPMQEDTGEILLYDQGDEWSVAYRKLTSQFYLKK
jgi:tRNA1Val (adenine37-N6)-methyltransferase